jgi:hypothetical protein
MAKIVDPDQLNQATEVVIDVGAKTIQLLIAGNLDDNDPGKSSGVTVQAVYSFLKEEWKDDNSLNKFKFPMKAIFEAKFEMINGWEWADQQSIDLLRDGGFRYTTDDSEYACIISLGDMDDSTGDQAYYQQTVGFDQSTATFDKKGEVNENIEVYDTGAGDYRDFLKVYLREQGKLFSEGNLLVDQDLSALTYQAYRVPLSNADDIKISIGDAEIATGVPFDGMDWSYLKGTGFSEWVDATTYTGEDVVYSTTEGRWYFTPTGGTSDGDDTDLPTSDTGVTDWEPYSGERQIGVNYYAFNRICDGNNGLAERIYEKAQYDLRQSSNINADGEGGASQGGFGTVNGDVAVLLCNFLGETLQTNPGVYIDNFNVNDQNRIEFFDITIDGGGVDSESVPVTTTKRTFPFVSAGDMEFSANLVSEPDADTKYIMYFLNDDAGDDSGNDFDTTGAIIVQDSSDLDISGQITAASKSFTFDYDNNTQRGVGSEGTDAPVIVTAQGLGGAEWVFAQFTITRATGLSFPVNAGDERNYLNP